MWLIIVVGFIGFTMLMGVHMGHDMTGFMTYHHVAGSIIYHHIGVRKKSFHHNVSKRNVKLIYMDGYQVFCTLYIKYVT